MLEGKWGNPEVPKLDRELEVTKESLEQELFSREEHTHFLSAQIIGISD